MRKLTLQIVSDVHLEFRQNAARINSLKPVSPNLALLGDIGNPKTTEYQNFIKSCSRNFDNVFLIAGNHEYYHHTIAEIDGFLRLFSQNLGNVHFLQNSAINLDGFKIIGCTLWSKIDPKIHGQISDYRYIYGKKNIRKITPNEILNIHQESVKYLEQELNPYLSANWTLPHIVLTHHAPLNNELILGSYKYLNSHSAFATNLEYLFRMPVVAWGYGHTHLNSRFDYIVNDHKIKVFTNQMGSKNTRGFQEGYCISLD